MKTVLLAGLLALSSAATAVATAASAASAPATLPRPKQYVVLSFDGSRSVQMWQETRGLAKELNAGITVFMSGVHFIPASLLKTHYDPPGPKYGPGTSAIKKILDSQQDTIPLRVEQIEDALDEGVEVGSHAVGHFDAGQGPGGLNWSSTDWISELTQFNDIVLNVFSINGLTEKFPGEGLAWKKRVGDSMKGFRAPLLSTNGTLMPALAKMGYKYDGSEVYPMESSLWPFMKKEGVWEIPMAQIPIAGTARKQVAMDYNFFVFDSHAVNDLPNSQFYEERFYQSLLNYFRHSYYGNRAPVHAGAHFDDWNGRAYFTAFFRFARTVCRLPEVDCVGGGELVRAMEEMGPARVAAYQHGQFARLPAPAGLKPIQTLDIKVGWSRGTDGSLAVAATGAHASAVRYEVSIDGARLDAGASVGRAASVAGSVGCAASVAGSVGCAQLGGGAVADRAAAANASLVGGLSKISLTEGLTLPNDSSVHEISVRAFRGSREVLSSTRRVQMRGGQLQNIELHDREERFQKGDLPGAHGQPDLSERAPIQWT